MRTMRRVLVILFLFCLCACGNRVEGTYYNVANGREFIELQPGGTFHLKAGDLELTGKYVVEGKAITLDPGTGLVARGTLENGLIVDNDGTKWQRK